MEDREKHFNHIFWFLSCATGIIMLYIFGVTFVPIPNNIIHFVDSNTGFFQSLLALMVGFFAGGTVQRNKTSDKNETT